MLLGKLVGLQNRDTILVLEESIQPDYHYFLVVWVSNLRVVKVSHDKACHLLLERFLGETAIICQ
jgi:hypothetical protein